LLTYFSRDLKHRTQKEDIYAITCAAIHERKISLDNIRIFVYKNMHSGFALLFIAPLLRHDSSR